MQRNPSVNDADLGPIQSVLIPTANATLLVPSTSVAEVAGVTSVSQTPAAPAFVLGVCNWRGLRLPVLSWEVLTGAGSAQPGPRSRLVVFYPLPGCDRLDFFAVLSTAAPQSRPINRDQLIAEPGAAQDGAYVASSCRIGDTAVVIPDLKAIRDAFSLS
jgi:chemosensory pili system protein ChpC